MFVIPNGPQGRRDLNRVIPNAPQGRRDLAVGLAHGVQKSKVPRRCAPSGRQDFWPALRGRLAPSGRHYFSDTKKEFFS